MNSLQRFKNQCEANVAILFAMSIMPLVAAAGMAIDYSRAAQRRAALQNALDAALRMTSRKTSTYADAAAIKTALKNYVVSSGFGDEEDERTKKLVVGSLSVDYQPVSPGVFEATATAKVPTRFMQIVGIDDVTIRVNARSNWRNAEVVIAVDTSITASSFTTIKSELPTLITNLIGTDGSVQVGLVPYGTAVRVPAAAYKNETWIRFTGEDMDEQRVCTGGEDGEDGEDGSGTCTYTPVDPNTWQGCIVDRDQDFDMNDAYDANNIHTKYPAITLCPANEQALATVVPMTTSASTLTTAISGWTQTARLHANQTIAVAWGHALLSNGIPFQQGQLTNTRKIFVLITSGENSSSRYYPGDLDERRIGACQSMSAAGIEIYTVYATPTTGGGAVEGCGEEGYAGSPQDYKQTFQSIVNKIREAQITN